MSSQPNKQQINDVIETAVYQIMNEHFPPLDAKCAVDLWKAKYAVKNLNGFVGFFDELAKLFELDQQRKQTLRMTLYRKVSMPQSGPSAVGNDSTVVAFDKNKVPEKVNEVSDCTKKQTFNSPAFVVFSTVGDRLIAQVQRTGHREFQDFTVAMKDYLQESSLPMQIAKYIVDWCTQESLVCKEEFSEEHYANVIHIFYMALCEALGPVDADAMLNDAINQANLLPEAQSYPPKKRFL